MNPLKLAVVILLISLTACDFGSKNNLCSSNFIGFSSYSEALQTIRNGSDYEISETINTSRSSWIRSAHYYSCNGERGYFLIRTDDKTYIHKQLPKSVWVRFKNAQSLGSFYNRNIKEQFQLEL